MSSLTPNLPTGWANRPIGELLREVDVRVADLPADQRQNIEVLSLTKRFGLIPQSERFNKRVATENVDKYKVVRRGWIVYNPYVIWEGAIHALRRDTPGIVSPVYPVWERIDDDNGFLDYVLRTPELIETYEKFSAGAVNRRRSIKKDDFCNIRIAVPPISEQRKIATVLGRVQREIDRQERLLALTAELTSALLNKVFTCGLRRESQKETEIGSVPENWDVVPLSSLLREPLRNGHSAKAINDGTGIRTLTLTAVTQREFSNENTKLTCADPNRVKDMWIQPGDILVERANTPEYVGLAAIYEGPSGWAIYPDLMIRVRVNTDQVIPYFLAENLLTERCRQYFQQNLRNTAGNFPKIDQATVEKTMVPLPPIVEQMEISAAIRTARQKWDLHRRKRAALNALFLTLLHQLMTAQIRVHDLDLPELETAAAA